MSTDRNIPIALSLSKPVLSGVEGGATERSEVISLRSMRGFDKLSSNGWGINK